MKGTKGIMGFIIFALVVVAALYVLSSKNYPQLPADDIHKVADETNVTQCMECHGPAKKAALKAKHPPKFECLKCHKPASKV